MADKSISTGDVKAIVDRVITFVQWIVGVTLALVFAATLAEHLGLSQRIIPAMDAYKLVLLAGAWALMTGRFKIG